MKRKGGILSRQLGTTVCSEIDFYEFINRIIKLLENLVCGNVPSIYTSLPMMELDLISELEKEMNMIGRHEEVILVDSEDFFDGLEFFKSLEKLRIEEWGLEGRIKRCAITVLSYSMGCVSLIHQIIVLYVKHFTVHGVLFMGMNGTDVEVI